MAGFDSTVQQMALLNSWMLYGSFLLSLIAASGLTYILSKRAAIVSEKIQSWAARIVISLAIGLIISVPLSRVLASAVSSLI
jgi:hypothetical protein